MRNFSTRRFFFIITFSPEPVVPSWAVGSSQLWAGTFVLQLHPESQNAVLFYSIPALPLNPIWYCSVDICYVCFQRPPRCEGILPSRNAKGRLYSSERLCMVLRQRVGTSLHLVMQIPPASLWVETRGHRSGFCSAEQAEWSDIYTHLLYICIYSTCSFKYIKNDSRN